MSPLRTRSIALAAAALFGAAVPALAQDHDADHGAHARAGGHGMHGMHGMPTDPAAMGEHIDMMVAHLMNGASAGQKAKVAGIAKAAVADLMPLRAQLAANHERALQMLAQPTLDPVALEALRVAQVQLMDQASRRVLQAVLDAADQMTPAQRAMFARHLHGLIGMAGH
jgi:hypothetical protein